MTSLLALLLLATNSQPSSSAAPPAPKASVATVSNVRRITLDPSGAPQLYVAHTAPNYPCLLSFPLPVDFAKVVCGSCNTEKALFRIDQLGDRGIAIKPRAWAEKVGMKPESYVTTLSVPLAGYAPINLQIEYVTDPKNADPSIVFSLPESVRDDLADTRAQIDKELGSKVTAAFLRAFAEPHDCKKLSERVRDQDILVEASELCWFGRRYFLRVNVENRGRDPLDMGTFELKYGSRGSLALATVETHVVAEHLEFKDATAVVLTWEIKDREAQPLRFDVTVRERGSRARTITLAKIEL